MTSRPSPLRRIAALATTKRITVWTIGLLLTSWSIYAYTMSSRGLVDRAGQLKGSDYVQFYVLGSLALEGRWDAIYDPAAHLTEARRRIDPDIAIYAPYPNYGPQIALAFAPLALLPWTSSLLLFLIAMTLCYATSVWILFRECPALASRRAIVALLAAAAPLYFAPLRYGQTSPFALLLWSLALAAMARDRRFLAGLAVGCLAYKPQLGLVVGIALLASKEWRAALGAATSALGQLAIGALAAGTHAVAHYVAILGSLAVNPDLIVVYPSEVHSLRGFVRLLVGSHRSIDLALVVAEVIALWFVVRGWRSAAPVRMRMALLATVTVLVSPHFLTYDLLLLTIPLIVLADWALEHRSDPRNAVVTVLLVLVYFAPYSANLARLTRLQPSTAACAMLAWVLYSMCTGARPLADREAIADLHVAIDAGHHFDDDARARIDRHAPRRHRDDAAHH